MAACRCNCGYSCGRQCDLDMLSCIEQHYRHDCEHVFDGPTVDYKTLGGAFVTAVTCSRCGLDAGQHDLEVGP